MTPPLKSTSEPVPLAVWPVAQVTAQHQRHGRYLKECSSHPGKMLPALAQRIIEEYSSPDDIVLDPMAGIGTTVAEGALLGRRCIGVDLEQRWVDIAEHNLGHMLEDRRRTSATMHVGDARSLGTILDAVAGTIDLIATSPPYSCDVGNPRRKQQETDDARLCSREEMNYSIDKANLGHARGNAYLTQMQQVYASCYRVLRPGGLLVTVTKNMRRKGRLVDLAGDTVALAQSVGFGYLQHNIALLCAVRDSALISRPSFWQTTKVRQARQHGIPRQLVVHEDVLVFVKPEAASV